MTKAKQKVNVCFICDKTDASEEHHVKELDSEYTIEVCKNCHTVLTKYQEEAIPKLKKYLEEKSKQEQLARILFRKIELEISSSHYLILISYSLQLIYN